MVKLSLKVAIGSNIFNVPAEAKFRVQLAMKKAIQDWIRHMLLYVDEHTVKSPTYPDARPLGMMPDWTGTMINSLKSIIRSSSLEDLEAKFFMGFGVDYWVWVDRGRPAGKVPIAPLLEWTRDLGLPDAVAYGKQQKMMKEFTPGYKFWRPLLREGYAYWHTAIRVHFTEKDIPYHLHGYDIVVEL